MLLAGTDGEDKEKNIEHVDDNANTEDTKHVFTVSENVSTWRKRIFIKAPQITWDKKKHCFVSSMKNEKKGKIPLHCLPMFLSSKLLNSIKWNHYVGTVPIFEMHNKGILILHYIIWAWIWIVWKKLRDVQQEQKKSMFFCE